MTLQEVRGIYYTNNPSLQETALKWYTKKFLEVKPGTVFDMGCGSAIIATGRITFNGKYIIEYFGFWINGEYRNVRGEVATITFPKEVTNPEHYLDKMREKGYIFSDGKVISRSYKSGDIVVDTREKIYIISSIYSDGTFDFHCCLGHNLIVGGHTVVTIDRFATSKERERLFKALKERNLMWNGTTIVPWRADEGDVYYNIDIGQTVETGVEHDQKCYMDGNYYSTYELAKQALDELLSK